MQFLNKKTQRFVQEKIPWDSRVPYTRQPSSQLSSRSASAESPTFRSGSESPVQRRRHSNEMEQVRPSSIGEEELQLQLALAMSREEHEEELRKQKSDDIKLQLAIDESRRQQDEGGQQTLAGLADQSRQKQSDPWGAPGGKQSDPWGASLPAPPGSHHKSHPPAPKNDPWASPAHQEAPPPADPWSSPPMSSPTQEQRPADPWGTPSSQQQSSPWGTPSASAAPRSGGSPFDSFGSPATNGTSNGTGNNIDEAFDVLGTRTSPAKLSSSTADGKTDPWNMMGMDSSLPTDQPKRNKTPQEFLGANSNLVNLDELVKPDQTSKKANNPFSSPQSTNPFEQTAPPRVPMSQLQANTYNSGFTQPSSAGLLPAPLVPMGTQVQQQPQQSYNPFL